MDGREWQSNCGLLWQFMTEATGLRWFIFYCQKRGDGEKHALRWAVCTLNRAVNMFRMQFYELPLSQSPGAQN